MNEKNKSFNSIYNHVTAYLVATYDLSPTNAQSVTSNDYLCIYEYQYDGKKYKYRTHQRDTFSPIPEIIELGFKKDPSKAYKINTDNYKNISKSSSKTTGIIIWCGLIISSVVIIFMLYNSIKVIIESEITIYAIFIFLVLLIIQLIRVDRFKLKTNINTKDKLIEEAILNNRTVTAYLTKSTYRSGSNEDSRGR